MIEAPLRGSDNFSPQFQLRSFLPSASVSENRSAFHWPRCGNNANIHSYREPLPYQDGPLKDYYNVKQYVLHRDGYQCRSGKKGKHSKKLHVHHVIFKSKGGPDTPENLLTLCETCHQDLHAGKFELKAKGKRSATKHATEMGIIKSQLDECGIAHQVTYGYETKYKREQVLRWLKTHANDAIAACLADGDHVRAVAANAVLTHRLQCKLNSLKFYERHPKAALPH